MTQYLLHRFPVEDQPAGRVVRAVDDDQARLHQFLQQRLPAQSKLRRAQANADEPVGKTPGHLDGRNKRRAGHHYFSPGAEAHHELPEQQIRAGAEHEHQQLDSGCVPDPAQKPPGSLRRDRSGAQLHRPLPHLSVAPFNPTLQPMPATGLTIRPFLILELMSLRATCPGIVRRVKTLFSGHARNWRRAVLTLYVQAVCHVEGAGTSCPGMRRRAFRIIDLRQIAVFGHRGRFSRNAKYYCNLHGYRGASDCRIGGRTSGLHPSSP